jgi:hypothetical protein
MKFVDMFLIQKMMSMNSFGTFISKGSYVINSQPLVVSSRCKNQSEMTELEVQKLRQIDKIK